MLAKSLRPATQGVRVDHDCPRPAGCATCTAFNSVSLVLRHSLPCCPPDCRFSDKQDYERKDAIAGKDHH